ncbi:MAG: hypothetical protein K2P93_00335 [Alphaproteobacteria bacterium]|nr:hypothetical protein [Alphaproteobacteria bacterium]
MLQFQKKINIKPNYLRNLSVILLSATLSFCLQGCMGVYEGGFECPPGEGVGCKSISEVNQMVEHGELPKKQNETQPSCQQCNSNPDFLQSPSEEPLIWYSPWVWEDA